MTEEIKTTTEDNKTVEMYFYIAEGKELWTSNLSFANLRSQYYGSLDVYVENIKVKNIN